MEFRQLGKCGLRVPALSLGTGTFGGTTDFFKNWGQTDVQQAKSLMRICLDAGLNMFDTADVYSDGVSEEILGQAVQELGVRDQVLISTKATFKAGKGPNDFGSSRYHLLKACDASLKRLKTDRIDVYIMHGMDLHTPVEETLHALETLVRDGKVLYIGCSNFSGWQLMKSLSASERNGWSRYVAHQAYYSLAGREFEWELMPLGLDQGVATMVWSPLAGGALSGKVRRGTQVPSDSRLAKADFVPFDKERLYDTVDVLDAIANECGKTVPQVALNWVLQRPTVANLVIGARNEDQLRQNLGAVGWALTKEQVARLDAVSDAQAAYPYWHQRWSPELGLGNPACIKTHQTANREE